MRPMGIDSYLTREPDDRFDDPDPQRADDAIREQRWNDFIEHIKLWLRSDGIAEVLRAVAAVYDFGQEHGGGPISDFAETEGWHGVVSAIARALREAQHQAEEVERRR